MYGRVAILLIYKSFIFCLRRPPGDPFFAFYQRRIMYIMYSLVCCGAGVCGMVAYKMLRLLCGFFVGMFNINEMYKVCSDFCGVRRWKWFGFVLV